MNTFLLGIVSLALMGATAAPLADVADVEPVPEAQIVQIEAGASVIPVAVSQDAGQAAKDAADDLEVSRLMAEAPDDGVFGDSVIVAPDTGVETRVSGFGFDDK